MKNKLRSEISKKNAKTQPRQQGGKFAGKINIDKSNPRVVLPKIDRARIKSTMILSPEAVQQLGTNRLSTTEETIKACKIIEEIEKQTIRTEETTAKKANANHICPARRSSTESTTK